jgi:hypothetical protein
VSSAQSSTHCPGNQISPRLPDPLWADSGAQPKSRFDAQGTGAEQLWGSATLTHNPIGTE